MYIESGAVTQPPVADFTGDPTSGYAPLTVQFTDKSTNGPTSWSWDFGDGVGTSSEQNPSYTYDNPGTYTVSLTAANAYGSDTNTKVDYITVSESTTPTIHVSNIIVTRKTAGPNLNGIAEVTIVDANNVPVANATVYGFFNEPNTSTKSGVTGTDGVATINGDKTKSSVAEFCFEVTDVVLSGSTYDSGANAVTKACESGWVNGANAAMSSPANAVPKVFGLLQNFPNPFKNETVITFGLPEASQVKLEIFNVRGERIAVLADRPFSEGFHSAHWNAAGFGSGIYFYRIEAGHFVQTKKMILLR